MPLVCSREQIQLDDPNRTPESLATRDFSAGSRGGLVVKFDDDSEVEDVESTLKDTITLNYEEARALLGRLEYQRCNYAAALEVLQGIDINNLTPRMIRAITERTQPRKNYPKEKHFQVNFMSLHSVSLLLEAILLKSKSLQLLNRARDAATECKTILDIVESAWPYGMPDMIGTENRLKEMFHKALKLLPELWKQAGSLHEAIDAYRRALWKTWNLDSELWAGLQKGLAVTLLYGGVEATIPPQPPQACHCITPKTNVEEATLLLVILVRKALNDEIKWDPEIMDHLSFALSLSGLFEYLANQVELLLPGIYSKIERWFVLALCYHAGGLDDVALNIVRNTWVISDRTRKPHIPSLLFGAKMCCMNPKYASEGTNMALLALELAQDEDKHFVGLISGLYGLCCEHCTKFALFDSERQRLQNVSLKSLQLAAAIEKDNSEVVFNLGMVNALQRNLGTAKKDVERHLRMVGGSSASGWKLLALVVSGQQNLIEAEGKVDKAIAASGLVGQPELLRLKAFLQVARAQPKRAIETYRILLALNQSEIEHQDWGKRFMMKQPENIEQLSWLDLAAFYRKLGSWSDSAVCLDKAKQVGYFSPRVWYETGMLSSAQSLYKDAMQAFLLSLSVEAEYVASLVSMGIVLRTAGGKSLPIARSFLMDAVHLEPTNHEAWLNLGYISRIEGSFEHAAECFQAAYELRESNPVQSFLQALS